MELKVWVEGIQRVVCGVTEKTTCQDVVYALAHATGRTGRFTLIERWRNHERLLAPMDHPLRVLMKWGDHSNDVHFILQRTPLEPSPGASAQPPQQPTTHPLQNHLPAHQNAQHSQTLPRYGTHQPQARLTHSNTIANMNSKPGSSVVSKPLPNSQSFPAFEGPRMPPPYRDPPPVGPPPAPSSTSSASSLQPLQQQANSSDDEPRGANLGRSFHGVKSPTPMHRRNLIKEFKSHHHQQNQRQGPPVNNINNNVVPATGGASRFVTPPPQLRPPPPYPNPPDVIGQISSSTINQHHQVAVKNLREIVESQRARIISQRAEMAKFDAELEFLDRQAKEAEELSEEVARLEDILDARESEVRELRSVEDEVERTRRQEEDLEVRLSKLRHQLANCESELDSGRGKIQSLADSLSVEQKQATEEQQSENSDDEQQRQRRGQSVEIQELYEEIERQKIASDELRRTADMLEEKIEETERMLNEKRQVAEDLAQEMRELNLESLKSMPVPLVSPETSKSPTEGLTSRRKIVGSPRQLENAAPTPKNPQGVWV